MRKWILLAAALSLTVTACGGSTTTTTGSSGDNGTATTSVASRLDTIKSRGKLICGVEGTIPGFSFVDQSGKYSGLDVDTCRAVAAALFGASDDIDSKIEYRNLDSTARFPALQNGEVDMLARNTTWTLSRDAAGGNGLEFAPTTFYDGQGVMVTKASGITNFDGLDGKSVCVETGTTTELNLASRAKEAGITVNEVKFQDSNAASAAYTEGRCEGFTSDRSQLAAKRTGLPNPDDNILLPDVLSKEPLGPVTINNDSAWFDVVKWVTFGLMQAEEFGITQANVDQMTSSDNPDIQGFLGAQGELGQQLGLPNDFMVAVIKTTGNYGEIFERNVGADSPLKLDRGLNNLWTEGGLIYSPPFR
ncbi:amino acid ABC transporter substrate-binding protein [Nodosilinea nodulosa]|uniref:amino acid ABC transporter substrate-binding protein n=1 Tax=Nodosilinea nodulosa TaxID=416001 RepID=UPI0004749B7E|nr:amino acid ABC transporter substrate-binding protein [Nodosilinea nodulosa]